MSFEPKPGMKIDLSGESIEFAPLEDSGPASVYVYAEAGKEGTVYKVVLATWLIRPDLIGKRELSCYFTLIIFREQQNGQNPSLVTRAHQTLDKTGYISLNHLIPSSG